MVMELTRPQTYTIAEFMALPDDGKLYELVRGEIIEMPGPSPRHGRLVTKIAYFLETYLEDKEIGHVFTMSNFNINPEASISRIPDLAFISYDRLPEETDEAANIIPDLAIEVISPSETSEKIQEKVEEYQKAGVRLIWSIYLNGQFVLVRHLDNPKITLLNLTDDLDGENIIPGFKLPVSKLFEVKKKLQEASDSFNNNAIQ